MASDMSNVFRNFFAIPQKIFIVYSAYAVSACFGSLGNLWSPELSSRVAKSPVRLIHLLVDAHRPYPEFIR